jgi:hypothetical protein
MNVTNFAQVFAEIFEDIFGIVPKPRIRKIGRSWVCSTGNSLLFGIGQSPQESYDRWLMVVKSRHESKQCSRN